MTAYRFIDAQKAIWPVRIICRALRVSRSAYYTWKQARTTARAAADATLSIHIKAIHRRSRGTYVLLTHGDHP